MHDLPSGDRPFPVVAKWLLIIPLLVVTGALVVLLGGAFLGFSRGIGPDETGGAVYVLLGFLLNLVIGFIIAFFGRRRGLSRGLCRVAFWAFTAPAWLFVLWLGWRIGEQVVSR